MGSAVRCAAIPTAVPTNFEKQGLAGSSVGLAPEMMTEDAKFALGF
jgi:hypothetical protein